MIKIAGRKVEITRLSKTIQSKQPELVAVYGRRRIGKTYLIRHVYQENISFEHTGLHNANMSDQLENFHNSILEYYPNINHSSIPISWLSAFRLLQKCIEKSKVRKKKVIFIDEFPWLATRRSKFLTAFENFWNSFASKRNDLVVVICGSAASYMVQNIIYNKGGLHNRITEKIRLLPFNLNEVSEFLKLKGIQYTYYDITQLYMSIGGIPHYLNQLEKGASVAQNIDRLCFSPNGFLVDEFDHIFASLFENDHYYKAMVLLLADVRQGVTRNEIIFTSDKHKSGGTLTKILTELIESGFITQYTPYKGNIKQSLYRLTDEYSFFYARFIRGRKSNGNGTWLNYYTKPSYRAWCGFSFETLCFKHIGQIKKAFGISQVYTEQGSWVKRTNEDETTKGAQIDLLIDRADRIINVCEVKYSEAPFVITKKYAEELRHKINAFKTDSKTRKNVFLAFITTYGVKENSHSLQLVQNSITVDNLFEPI